MYRRRVARDQRKDDIPVALWFLLLSFKGCGKCRFTVLTIVGTPPCGCPCLNWHTKPGTRKGMPLHINKWYFSKYRILKEKQNIPEGHSMAIAMLNRLFTELASQGWPQLPQDKVEENSTPPAMQENRALQVPFQNWKLNSLFPINY